MPLYLNGTYTYTTADDPTPSIVKLIGIHESIVVVTTLAGGGMDEHVITRRDFEQFAELRLVWNDRHYLVGRRDNTGVLYPQEVRTGDTITDREWAIDLSLVPKEAWLFGYHVANGG